MSSSDEGTSKAGRNAGQQFGIYPRVIGESDLDPTARCVYMALALHADADGHIPKWATPDQERIGQLSGVSRRQTVTAAVRRLTDGGWIIVEQHRVRDERGRWATETSYDLWPTIQREAERAAAARGRLASTEPHRGRETHPDRGRLAQHRTVDVSRNIEPDLVSKPTTDQTISRERSGEVAITDEPPRSWVGQVIDDFTIAVPEAPALHTPSQYGSVRKAAPDQWGLDEWRRAIIGFRAALDDPGEWPPASFDRFLAELGRWYGRGQQVITRGDPAAGRTARRDQDTANEELRRLATREDA